MVHVVQSLHDFDDDPLIILRQIFTHDEQIVQPHDRYLREKRVQAIHAHHFQAMIAEQPIAMVATYDHRALRPLTINSNQL